jgi:hypothetical protein
VKTVFVKRDMELYMIDLSREKSAGFKTGFYGVWHNGDFLESLSEFGLGIFL